MKTYLDVSCFNRPFDDQQQTRIRLETVAVTTIFERIDNGELTLLASQMCLIEIDAIQDDYRRTRVQMLLPDAKNIIALNSSIFDRGAELEKIGFKSADALHIAAAEELAADIFLTCDDRLCRIAKRRIHDLHVRVLNPVDWIKEIEDANA